MCLEDHIEAIYLRCFHDCGSRDIVFFALWDLHKICGQNKRYILDISSNCTVMSVAKATECNETTPTMEYTTIANITQTSIYVCMYVIMVY